MSTLFTARKLKNNSKAAYRNDESDANNNNKNNNKNNEAQEFKTITATETAATATATTTTAVSPTSSSGDSFVELTRTDKYKVLKLPDLPSVIANDIEAHILQYGSSIYKNYSILIDNSSIYIYHFKEHGIAMAFSYALNPYALKPFALLVDNNNDVTDEELDDPGLVIIDSYTGSLKYYESINNAPALKVLNYKILDMNLNLNKNEFVTECEYVKDMDSIFITTNFKKVSLINLRDNLGKPKLNKIDIMSGIWGSMKLFGSIFKGGMKLDYDLSDYIINSSRIVSIKKKENRLAIQDSDGNFHLFEIKSNNKVVELFQKNLKETLASFIEPLYPNVFRSFKVLDMIPLPLKNVYLVLISFNKDEDDDDNDDEKYLVLYSVEINESTKSVTLYSTYKSTCYIATKLDRPKLVLPKPFNFCYIVLESSVIMIEVMTSLKPIDMSNANYKPRWEDAITLKRGVSVVGYDHSQSIENGLMLVTSRSGILKIERIPDENDTEPTEMSDYEYNLKLQQRPMMYIKSYIEQAIYNHTDGSLDNPVFFKFPKYQYLTKDVENAILNVINDLVFNKNFKDSYKNYPSVDDFLIQINLTYEKLINYIVENFISAISNDLKIFILKKYEKLKIAKEFYSSFNSSLPGRYNTILIKSIKDIVNDEEVKEKNMISFFYFNKLDKIDELISAFITNFLEDIGPRVENIDASKIANILNLTFVNGYIDIEKTLRYNAQNLDLWNYDETTLLVKPFSVESSLLLFKVNEIFKLFYKNYYELLLQKSFKDDFLFKIGSDLLGIAEFLFYIFNDSISYLSKTEKTKSQLLLELTTEYEETKSKWLDILILFDRKELILRMAENFEDMLTITEILDHNRIRFKTEPDSKDLLKEETAFIENTFNLYFEKFKYRFASCFYKYLIKNKDFKILFFRFSKYATYLDQFFKENRQYANISWIKYLLDEKFEKAGLTLIDCKEEKYITNRSLQLSTAKLSLLSIRTEFRDKQYLDNLIKEISLDLKIISYQKELYENILQFLIDDNDINKQESNVMNNLTKNDYFGKNPATNFKENFFKKEVSKFLSNKILTKYELIDLLTMIDLTLNSSLELNFAKGFNILKIADSDNFEYKLFFRRLFIVDDWKKINSEIKQVNDTGKNDDSNLELIKNTVLFKNVREILRESAENTIVFSTFSEFENISQVSISELKRWLQLDDSDLLKKIYQDILVETEILKENFTRHGLRDYIKLVSTFYNNDISDYQDIQMTEG
ncbi:hypothetical protein PACTADRAFT_185398 [Pachysolen tannophilus NRRL Y-2460]|uniref:Uncharacterized protein n=1 Tax=Pachysolen tannophilus NRRL Y-2460 TaxID=669874 RepID=A0A1E4U2F7_PACTA|nr:hypothetical protein PACTADRAFT_185398 [Pachysolen tannophilus NRRL Y-2460]